MQGGWRQAGAPSRAAGDVATFFGVMHVVAVAVALLVALSLLVTATLATFAIRIALFGRPRAHKVRGARGFFRAWWRWVRRAEPRRRPRPRGLAPVIPLDAARRARAAR